MRVKKNSEDNWAAERDLSYIQEYNRIVNDPKRYRAAQRAAQAKMNEYGTMFGDGKKKTRKR